MSELKQVIYFRQTSPLGPWYECEAGDIGAVAFVRRTQPEATKPAQDLGAVDSETVKDAARYRLIKSSIGMFGGWWQVQISATRDVESKDMEAQFERDVDARIAAMRSNTAGGG